jgi:hypothetical protein
MVRGKHAGSMGIKPQLDDMAPAFAFLPRGAADIQQANARLFLAAPAMLVALKYVLSRVDGNDVTLNTVLREAIGEAEGEVNV